MPMMRSAKPFSVNFPSPLTAKGKTNFINVINKKADCYNRVFVVSNIILLILENFLSIAEVAFLFASAFVIV